MGPDGGVGVPGTCIQVPAQGLLGAGWGLSDNTVAGIGDKGGGGGEGSEADEDGGEHHKVISVELQPGVKFLNVV